MPDRESGARRPLVVPESVLRQVILVLDEVKAASFGSRPVPVQTLTELGATCALLRRQLEAHPTSEFQPVVKRQERGTCPECGVSIPIVARRWVQEHSVRDTDDQQARGNPPRCQGSLLTIDVGTSSMATNTGPVPTSQPPSLLVDDPTGRQPDESVVMPAGIMRRRLPPHPASIGEADRLVRRLVTSAGRSGLLDTAARLVEVLVTGATVRAETSIDLTCTIVLDQLRFTVGDDNPRPWGPQSDPRILFDNHPAQMLLACLADDWGVITTPTGSTAWFVLTERPSASQSTRD